MKAIAGCYSKHSLHISNSYCSPCSSKSKPSCSSSSISHNPIPSIQNSVTCFYQSKIPNANEEEDEEEEEVSTSITWTSNLIGKGFNIQLMTNSDTSSDQLRKCKGSKTIVTRSGSRFNVKWDLSNAEYDNGPEPSRTFYVTVCKNSKPVLTLGDYKSQRYVNYALVSRTECFSGSCVTKWKFCDTGKLHDIVIKCVMEENEGGKNHVLMVLVDKKRVVNVKKLEWNFRGNQCVFVDGIVVDLMWDVHEWIHNPVFGNGLFLFKTRNGIGRRLWLVEDERFDENGFSLLVISCKKHSLIS